MLTARATKNGDPERHIPLNSTALLAFQQLKVAYPARLSGRAPVFLNSEGGPLRGHRDWFEPIIEDVGLEEYTWHCNRHTFASRLVMAGVHLTVVKELMGHKSIAMTMRYAHLAPEHNAAAVELISSRQVATKSATSSRTDPAVIKNVELNA